MTTIGGTYNLGVVRLGAGFQRETAQGNAVTFDSSKAYALTAVLPYGAFTPYAKIGGRSYSGGTGVNGTNTQIANIGTRYALSKRSYVYADYVRNSASLSSISATANTNPKQVSLGISHSF